MSIIRNTRSGQTTKTTDGSVTIKTFPKGEYFISGRGHYPRYWVGLNNKYLKPAASPWGVMSLALNDTIVVKCEIASDASGAIFGSTDSLSIVKDGSSIKWKNGSTVLRTESWKEGAHLYGFYNTSNGMYPYYDRDISGTRITSCSIKSVRIGGYDTGACMYSTTQTYAIKVYEVIGVFSYVKNSAVSERAVTHYYAATNQASGDSPRMFETRFHAPDCYMEVGDGSAVSGVTAAAHVENFPDNIPGYGVQLLDLTTVFKGPYRDTIGMVAGDNESGAYSNADAAEVLKNGNETRNMAFRLADDGTTPTNPVPLPAGWSINNRAASFYEYLKGELIFGRRPKWSIWNDAIKFGKYSDQSAQPNILRFNYLAENDGTFNNKFELGKFNGYNEKKTYPPSFSINDELEMEFHNGVACTIVSADYIVGSDSTADENSVFPYSQGAGGLSTVKLGNLPLWNYTKAELDAGTPALQNMRAVSGGLIFYISDNAVLVFFQATEQTYTEGGATYPMPFCADSDQATLNKFKFDGFSGEAFFQETLSDYLRRVLTTAGASGIDLKVAMALSLVKSPTPTNLNIIDCSNLVPAQTSHVIGAFNTRQRTASYSGVYGDRFIVGENGGVVRVGSNEYKMCIAQQYKGAGSTRISHQITPAGETLVHYGYGIATNFGVVDASGNIQTMFDSNGNPLYVAFMVATAGAVHSSAGPTAIKDRFIAFAKIFKNTAVSSGTNGYLLPFNEAAWFTRNLYSQLSAYNNRTETEVAAAWFMWQDLLSPGIQRGSGGKAPTESTSTDSFPKRYTYPINNVETPAPVTAHFKVFKLSEAPHCWNVYQDGHRKWNDTTACPYIAPAANSLEYYFHYDNNLIAYGLTDCIDAYISIWSGNTWQSTVSQMATALNGRTVSVYYQVPFEPQEQRVTTGPVSFSVSGLSSSVTHKEFTNGNFKLVIDLNVQIPFWTTLKNDAYGMLLNGFVRMRVENSSDDLKAKTFFINIL